MTQQASTRTDRFTALCGMFTCDGALKGHLTTTPHPGYGASMPEPLHIEIPANVVDALRLPEQERIARLRLELAVSLYEQGILGRGKATRLADLSRWEMNRILAERQVPMHYGPEELAEDLHHGRGDQ